MTIATALVTGNTIFLMAAVILWAVGKNVFGIAGLAVDFSGLGNLLRFLTLILFAVTVALVGFWSVRGGAAKTANIGKALVSLVILLAAFSLVAQL